MDMNEKLINSRISCISSLDKFLNEKYVVESGTPWSNVINQTGGCFYIPFEFNNNIVESDIYNDEILGLGEGFYSNELPIEVMFKYLEECRKAGYVRHLSEKQFSKIRGNNLPTHPVSTIEKSCLWFDFDILQRNDARFSDMSYSVLIQTITDIIIKIILVEQESMEFHAVVLRKPELIRVSHDGQLLYKESFHLRIFLAFDKNTKKYIRNKLISSDCLEVIFRNHDLYEDMEKIIDAGSTRNPALFLGSMKPKGKVPHQFYKLYKVFTYLNTKISPNVQELTEFDPITIPPEPKLGKTGKKTGGFINHPNIYKYNLCYETSLCYEAPNGLIKKPAYEIKPEFVIDIQIEAEQTKKKYIEKWEIEENLNNVYNLTINNFQANYIAKILGLLDKKRSDDYHSWFKIICILANTNADFKPLAIYFTQRCARKWYKRGIHNIDTIWESALNSESLEEEYQNLKINTLYYWAKLDNPKNYSILKKTNAFEIIRHHAYEYGGELNDTVLSSTLFAMYGNKFKTDMADKNNILWYEFKTPKDALGYRDSYYKWCIEGNRPDSLTSYINKKLPEYLKQVIAYCKDVLKKFNSKEQTDEIKELIKYNEAVKNKLMKWCNKLGNSSCSNSIIRRCEVEFKHKGFIHELDKSADHIGVYNGVLQLKPIVRLIDTYHDIPISRCMGTDYISIDFENSFVKEMYSALRSIYIEEDVFEFKMMLLASCLDRHRPPPYFSINNGGGSNGKSFVESMIESVFATCDNNGYYMPLPPSFLTKERSAGGGPDAELASLVWARYVSFNEAEEGEIFRISMIKWITGETISCNGKYKDQMTFPSFFLASLNTNYTPKISGTDYGTWRRIKFYNHKAKFVSNPDPENPYEIKENPDCLEKWPRDINYKRAFLSILVYFYEKLQKEFKGDLRRVPHPTIIQETLQFQKEQDTLTRFIDEMMIKDNTETSYIELIAITQQYLNWYKMNEGPTNKLSIPGIKKNIGDHNIFKKCWDISDGRQRLKYYRFRDENDTSSARVSNPNEHISEPVDNIELISVITDTNNDNIDTNTNIDNSESDSHEKSDGEGNDWDFDLDLCFEDDEIFN